MRNGNSKNDIDRRTYHEIDIYYGIGYRLTSKYA